MEQDKNNRLDELFNQARTEPSKVSFDEIKEQFISNSVGLGNGATANKLLQLSNLKIIVMIATLSVMVGGALFFMNSSEKPENNKTTVNETIEHVIEIDTEDAKHDKAIQEHLEKVKQLPLNLKEVYQVKRKLAFKLKEAPLDSAKKASVANAISKKNQEILLDTAYHFPNLGYEEITANNRQKAKMVGKYKKIKKKRTAAGDYKSDVSGFVYIPSGSYKSGEQQVSVQSFYMKQTEVSNLEYRTFLFDLLIQGRKHDFLKAKPDQAMWVKEYNYSFNKPMQENYFSHPAYDNYPAVGMTREGAEMYCVWLTEELNNASGGQKINDVRIPSNYEWEYAASGGGKATPYPWGGPYLRNAKGCYLANFKPKKNSFNDDGGFHTVKVFSYNPNEFGLYCMAGNAAEMVYYKNENRLPGTKGGSWTSVGQELQIIDGEDRFKGKTDPSVNVGFRPVITYLKGGNNARLIGQYGGKTIDVDFPGVEKVAHNFYFDQTEVTNFAWREYLYWLSKEHGKTSAQYKAALPDTTVWRTEFKFHEPYVQHYYRHPAYQNYPVVGITHQQAVAFCKWRTDRVKELFETQKTDKKYKNKVFPKDFEYRLPTKAEWEKVARVGYSLKTLKRLESKHRGEARYNLKRKKSSFNGVAGKLNDAADVTAPVISYWPNELGLYNLIGNVAEMVADNGIAKGGAWNVAEEEVSVEKNMIYNGPQNWLGFRCVVEIKD